MPKQLGKILGKLSFPVAYALNRPFFLYLNKLMLELALRGLGLAITYRGRFGIDYGEEKFLQRIDRFLDGKTVLDVGANVGNYAQAVLTVTPRVKLFSFDPHPKSCSRCWPSGPRGVHWDR